MTRLDALILSTPLIAVMVVLCAVLLFQRRGRNRRVARRAWPRKGTTAPTGYFADSAKRPGPECAGKAG